MRRRYVAVRSQKTSSEHALFPQALRRIRDATSDESAKRMQIPPEQVRPPLSPPLNNSLLPINMVSYMDRCGQRPSMHALHFTRPPPSSIKFLLPIDSG